MYGGMRPKPQSTPSQLKPPPLMPPLPQEDASQTAIDSHLLNHARGDASQTAVNPLPIDAIAIDAAAKFTKRVTGGYSDQQAYD